MLLSEPIKPIKQLKVGDISITECEIEIRYRERMYHSQMGMFAIPFLDHKRLVRLHCMAFGTRRIDDPVFKCEPIPWKLFTNASCEAEDRGRGKEVRM